MPQINLKVNLEQLEHTSRPARQLSVAPVRGGCASDALFTTLGIVNGCRDRNSNRDVYVGVAPFGQAIVPWRFE